MLNRTNILTALIFGVGAVAFANSGCELISSVDRTKIPGGTGGSATGGGTNPTGGGTTTNPTGGGTTNPTGGGTMANGGGGSGGTASGGGGASAGGGGAAQGGGGAAPTCTDGRMDGSETDKDCGGSCPQCADGKKCSIDGDCTSGVCKATPGPGKTCQAPSCTDGVKNGTETDKDCGGSCATKCGPGKGCAVNGDCVGPVGSSLCAGSPLVCQDSCFDGVQDSPGGIPETGVDCGGPCPNVCP